MRERRSYFPYWCCIVFLFLCSIQQAFANNLKGIRVWPAPDETRVVIDLDAPAKHSFFSLSNPYRLVVDLKDTRVKMPLPKVVQGSQVLKKVRTSTAPSSSSVRLVFELSKNVTASIFTLPPAGNYGYRLVIDLPHNKKLTPVSATTPHHGTTLPTGESDIVVAIDPGHGGEDPGAIGPYRRKEKVVTLAIAKKLAAKIDSTPGMKAVLTRRGDYFVSLNKRSEIARGKKAHLLVSIHADGFSSSKPRGASVWVLSNRRANSEIGRWLEDSEKQSELLGGGAVLSNNQDDEYLSKTVLDLQFSFAQKEGVDVADNILKELGKFAKLHKGKSQYASLAVLKSPDIPSLLVETGFITNHAESKLLYTKKYQSRIANAIYTGIYSYFKAKPPEGTLFDARRTMTKHKVKSGESLSLIAQRYGTTTSAIMSVNKMKSSKLYVGKTLLIPSHMPSKVSAKAQKKEVTPAAVAKTKTKLKVVWHKVRKGEYLSKIAKRYAMGLSRLKSLNHLSSNMLSVGQRLKVEMRVPVYKTHTVRRGEYLSKLAKRYKTTVTTLKKLNSLRTTTLEIGQKLQVPNN